MSGTLPLPWMCQSPVLSQGSHSKNVNMVERILDLGLTTLTLTKTIDFVNGHQNQVLPPPD